MVSPNTLKYLSNQKQKDAHVLLQKRRNNAAIYLMGYALEFALKRKVSMTLGFNQGFPEINSDFTQYSNQISVFNTISSGIQLTQLRQIKNHDLNQLLTYSGAEARIIASHYNDWLVVKDWNPENRYKIKRYTSVKTKSFITSVKKILMQIS